jgi:type VI secretion system protein ImpH
MHAPRRRSHTGVIQHLLKRPHSFGFFQAVRMLELFFRRQRCAQGEVVSREIRFRASLSTAFPASEIERLVALDVAGVEPSAPIDAEAERQALRDIHSVHLTPAFFGLLGQQGVLPAHYTEQLAEREVFSRDAAARHFLELFSNRATGLFYSAWKKYRPALHYESDRHKTFMPVVMALAGYGPQGTRERSDYGVAGLHDEVAAHYAGLLRHRPVSAVQIQRLLGDYFGIAIRVEQFVGHWYVVPETQRTSLGGSAAVLGKTALCGARVWQRNLRVRLWLGPLKRGDYEQFLPQGSARPALSQWLRMLTGDALEYEVKPVLHKDAVRGTTLSAGSEARLGWDAFLCTRPAVQDCADVSYTMNTSAATLAADATASRQGRAA